MRDGDRGGGRWKGLTSSLLAVLIGLAPSLLFVDEVRAGADRTQRVVIRVAPSGGDDTESLQAALDAASAAGPGAVIKLAAGTFRVGRPLVGLNFDGTIRGAGMAETTIVADGSVNPDGLFHLVPAQEAAALRSFVYPVLFLFLEADVDRFGQPVTSRRSQRLTVEDLTMEASGRTVAHFDINENADTERLYSFIWIEGFRPDWTNSHDQTPADLGAIDAEHAQVSTLRASFRDVHFEGRNQARDEDEPGGPFDPNPDVRNALIIEGAVALVQPPPDPFFFFRPINVALEFDGSVFSHFPGQGGIFAPQLVGRNDPAWTFGPDAVAGSVVIRDSVFEDTPNGLLAGDLSDVRVIVDESVFRRVDYGVSLWTNYQATDLDAIGYPAGVPSRVTINGSTFEDTAAAAIWMDEYLGPSHVDLRVNSNDFILDGPPQLGLLGTAVEGARIVGNSFSGQGYAGVVALGSARWKIHGNDFCEFDVPPSAEASPELGLPTNESEAPIVLLDSVDNRVSGNDCA